MAEENTHTEYNEVMNLYNILRQHGYEKDAKDVMTEIKGKYSEGTYAPPEEIKVGLEAKLEEHGIKIPALTSKEQRGLEQKAIQKKGGFASLAESIGGIFSQPYIRPVATAASVLLLFYI